MAVEFKVDHTRSSIYHFLPKDIKFKPELNGRHELPNIEPLIADMVLRGQLEPILVRNDGGAPVLVAGFSRWRAAVEINKRRLTEIPFRLACVYFKGSEQQAVLANISENRIRNSTTPIDDGYNIARLERFGMSHEQIATHYGEDVPWVNKRLALVSLSAESQEALRQGVVKPSAAVALAKLSEDEQRRAVKESREKGKPLTTGAIKRSAPQAPKKVTVDSLIRAVSKGQAVPFAWDSAVDAQEFCVRALRYVEGQ